MYVPSHFFYVPNVFDRRADFPPLLVTWSMRYTPDMDRVWAGVVRGQGTRDLRPVWGFDGWRTKESLVPLVVR